MPIFVPGSDNDSDGPGRFPVKKQTMILEFINSIEKTNGTNRYDISICHIVYDHDVNISFGKFPEPARELFRVHYSWKNAKRSMFNLTLKPTKTLAESEKLMAKKINELEEKIK